MLPQHSLDTMKIRVTIQDVAEIAGVATSTVSRALSGDRGVGDETRSRIVRIAKEIGYQSSGAARSLRTSRSLTIAMLAPDLENPGNQAQVRAAISAAAARGYAVMVFDYSAGSAGGLSVIDRMRKSDIDGVLLGAVRLKVTAELLDLFGSEMAVEFGGDQEHPPEQGAFIVDGATWLDYETAACTLAGRRLFGMGHKHIAYVDWRDQSRLGRTRLDAFKACARASGLPESSVVLLRAGRKEEAVGLVQHLLANSPAPTALISGNGVMTPYVLEGVHSVNARIPDDLSFIACGDSPWHRAFQPPLSVIRRNSEAEAECMVDRLIARIEGRDVPQMDIQPTEFIDRASIAPAPMAGRVRSGADVPFQGV